jgi:hypothetical protein
MPDEVRDGEIVWLESSTNGRSCGSHECCGKHLCVGDLVRFRLVILEGSDDGQDTEAMKVINIKDGTEACHVGFLQRYIVKGARMEELTNAYGRVILLYKDSTIEMMKLKNKRLLGMASFRLLADIQITEKGLYILKVSLITLSISIRKFSCSSFLL